jgi:membrane fusion protein (multidrug efflux system)
MSEHSAVRRPLPHRLLPLGAAVLLAASLAACGDNKGAAAGAHAMPPPEVAVVTVQPGTVTLTTDLPGRLEPSRIAEVRARAAGILQKRLFQEGSDVRAGQTLFTIDPAPYQATLQSAEAQLAQAQAQLAQTSATVTRYRPLVDANAVSKQEFDAAVAAEKAAQAQVAAARAAIKTASINLGYATVTAPISGRIGRALVTEGALVGQGDATKLAVVQQINPLYLNVTQSATDAMRLRQLLAAGHLARDGKSAAVKIVLEDGTVYPHAGRLLFADQTVDPATGQILLRAEVPNPDGVLLPGLYVRAVVEQAQVPNAMLVPQQAVTRGTQGDSVMVVAADGTVAPRPVTIGAAQGQNWVVTEGLKPGEQVMVEGAMKVMMGARTVKPVTWDPNKAAKPTGQAEQAPKAGASSASAAASAPAPAASR